MRAQVLGLAASAASVVAMGADSIAMGQGAFLMIHRSWGLTVGNTNDHADTAAVLAQIDDSMARTYSSKSKRPADDMLALMNEETWFDADAAIEAGLAEQLMPDPSDEAALARFDLSAYRRTPAGLSHARERAEVRSAADIERILLAGGLRGRAAKLGSHACFDALNGAPSRELENLLSQIRSATAELTKEHSK